METENLEIIKMLLLIGISVPIGYFMTVMEKTAWAEARPNLTFCLFMLSMVGMAFLGELAVRGGFVLPVVGLFLGGRIRSSQDRKKAEAARKIMLAQAVQDLEQRLRANLASGSGQHVDITKIDQEAVDTVTKKLNDEGYAVAILRNQYAKGADVTMCAYNKPKTS
jgi:hypothetical protein